MRRHVAVRWALLLVAVPFALTVPASAAVGDGASVPGDAVAIVGEAPISNDEFAHWMTVAATSREVSIDAPITGMVPVPPDFTECVAAATAALPEKPPKGKTTPTAAQLKVRCRQEYEELRDQVLQFLISGRWILGEAASQGIALTDQQVQAEFIKQKKQSYPKEADFRKFLKRSGMTIDDLLLRVKVDTLSDRLRGKVTKGAAAPTRAQIKAYYVKHKKSRFRRKTLKQATPQIARTLKQQRQQRALDAFITAFHEGWKARTDCRVGYVIELCAGAPAPTS